jgi:hypothetical protein
MTETPARRGGKFGDQLFCGRQVNDRYVCQGPVGIVLVAEDGFEDVYPMPGHVQRPDGSIELSKAAAAKPEAGRKSLRKSQRQRVGGIPGKRPLTDLINFGWMRGPALRLPARMPCPECKTIAIVGSSLLHSSRTQQDV